MELNNLKKPVGSKHLPKRVGLGIGSGMGKISTRRQKGQGAKQGSKVPLGFEGGNFPIYRFASPNRVEYNIESLSDIDKCFDNNKEVTLTTLLFVGLIDNLNRPVKILSNGTLSKKVNVAVQAYSKTAKEAIEKCGGEANVVTLKDSRIELQKVLYGEVKENNKEKSSEVKKEEKKAVSKKETPAKVTEKKETSSKLFQRKKQKLKLLKRKKQKQKQQKELKKKVINEKISRIF